jgi:hypothetical protein
MNNAVRSLAVSGPDLYAGGDFTTAGGVAANKIAKWNGSAWSALGSGMNSVVFALAEKSSSGLIVGGAFTFAGTNLSPYLAQANVSTITSVTGVTGPANGGYNAGTVLTFTVNYSGPVTVTGNPQLALTIGLITRQASYVSGSGSSTLTFTYTVQPGETDSDGITVASPLSLNGGTIVDSGSAAAQLTFTPPDTSKVLVDGIPPTVASVVRFNNAAQVLAGGPQTVNFQVTYSEPVTNVVPASFSILNKNGGTVQGTIGAITGGPRIYLVPVNITSGYGEFTLRVN